MKEGAFKNLKLQNNIINNMEAEEHIKCFPQYVEKTGHLHFMRPIRYGEFNTPMSDVASDYHPKMMFMSLKVNMRMRNGMRKGMGIWVRVRDSD